MHHILDDLTVVVGLDQKTFPLFSVAVETWKRFRPELFLCPWLVFYDSAAAKDREQVREQVRDYFQRRHKLSPTLVASKTASIYESQREFMLTGWVYVPAQVRTKWFLKIDCDVLALDDRPVNEWCKPEWTEGNPDIIASGWRYTRAKGGGGTIVDWAKRLEQWGDLIAPDTPRLGLHNHVNIESNTISMPRWCSWVSYYRTDWYRKFATACNMWDGGKLVVPSQDTCAWYFQERTNGICVKAKQKRYGWTNVPSLSNLKTKASQALSQVRPSFS